MLARIGTVLDDQKCESAFSFSTKSRVYLAIDLSTQNLQELCAVSNEFALPRAIVDFERHLFVAWKQKIT
jgi:hypothetical protein